MTGELNEDDIVAVEKAYSEVDPEEMGGTELRTRRICLDSPGGKYLVGVNLASMFRQKGISTYVDRHASCLSACALAFMGGYEFQYSGEEQGPNRTIEVGAVLGFHAPYLSVAKQNYTKDDIEAAYAFANLSIAKFLGLANRRGQFSAEPLFSSSLLQETLQKSPSEFYLIDTVAKAVRWNISIDGVALAPKATGLSYIYACENFMSAAKDEFVSRHQYGQDNNELISVTNFANERGNGVRAIVEFAGYVSERCFIDVKQEKNSAVYATLAYDDEFTGVKVGNSSEYFSGAFLQPAAFFEGSTKLLDLPIVAK